jgi:hypothetical protein
VRRGAKDGTECTRERVDGEGIAADGCGLEQRQTFKRAIETLRVRSDDPISFDSEAHELPVAVARCISDHVDHEVRLAVAGKGL